MNKETPRQSWVKSGYQQVRERQQFEQNAKDFAKALFTQDNPVSKEINTFIKLMGDRIERGYPVEMAETDTLVVMVNLARNTTQDMLNQQAKQQAKQQQSGQPSSNLTTPEGMANALNFADSLASQYMDGQVGAIENALNEEAAATSAAADDAAAAESATENDTAATQTQVTTDADASEENSKPNTSAGATEKFIEGTLFISGLKEGLDAHYARNFASETIKVLTGDVEATETHALDEAESLAPKLEPKEDFKDE